MNRLLLTAAFLAAMSVPAAATLDVEVLDNGVVVGTGNSVTGSISLNVSDPAFTLLTLVASGVPSLPGGDLASVTLDVTSGAITTTHNLEVDVFQSGISVPAGGTESTFTANDLIGSPGPTTESTFINGTSGTLGTLLETATFAPGGDNSAGPLGALAPDLTADAHQYLIAFTAPGQSATDTIELSTGVPEPSTWAMLLVGFAFLGWGARRVNQYG